MLEAINGWKTYIGIIVTIIGMTGAAKYVTPDQATALVTGILDIAGIVMTIIGAVHKDIKIADAEVGY
jgi:hypothetical protein